MHLSYTFPNPLARLAGLLDLVERSRSAARTLDEVQNKTLVGQDDPKGEPLADHHDDLESLSLSRCGSSLDPASHDLDAMSLSRVEPTDPRHVEDLSNASLSRTIPRVSR
jgi:hypothetical protein